MTTDKHSKGFVVSDLHVFTHRTDTDLITQQVNEAARSHDFGVLNGDIFDFAWSYFSSPHETIENAYNWLVELLDKHPHCHIYYILGNHDAVPAFVERISQLKRENFSLEMSHKLLGSHLFLHGDLPLQNKNPFERHIKQEKPQKGKLANRFYHHAIQLRLHKAVSAFFTPRYCAKKILRSIEQFQPEMMGSLKHLYFGHTHNPFEAFEYRGIHFYNTGSSVKHSKMNIIKVIL